MRIHCLITRFFLARYLSGELGRRPELFLRRHLDECQECRDRMRKSGKWAEEYSGIEPPRVSEDEWAGVWSRVLERVEIEENEGSPLHEAVPFRMDRGRARYAIVAAAAVVLVAGALVRLAWVDDQAQQTSIASYIQYHEDAVDGHVLLENHFWSAQVLPVSYTAGK